MAFQLPPASASPPMFGGQPQYQQQPTQQPYQPTLQSTQAVQPLMQPQQQPIQTALPPASAPAPNFRNYLGTQNTGGIRPGPQINGLAQRVGNISLQGATPQFGRFAVGVN